jgi:hypothetical protein
VGVYLLRGLTCNGGRRRRKRRRGRREVVALRWIRGYYGDSEESKKWR